MDRKMIYPGQIPLETDLLDTNRFALIGLGKLAAAVLGTTTLVNGLACTPTAPASMQVQVAAGEIYSLQNLDGTAYSSLAADTTHSLLKQGLLMDAVNLSCPAPATSGQSVNYLVQAIYQDIDAQPLTLPYYNVSNPTQAYSGPAGSGTAQNTVRKGVCTVSVKAGIATTTGSQQTPAPDVGYVGLYSVTVAYGQTTITAGNIAVVSGAPILSETLLQKISVATGDARYALLSSQGANAQTQPYTAFTTTGATGAFVLTPSPAIAAYAANQRFRVKFHAVGNGADTLAVSGLAAKNLKQYDSTGAKVAPVLAANQLVDVEYDGVDMVILDPLPPLSAQGNFQGLNSTNVSATLALSDLGKLYAFYGSTTGQTLTLPALASIPVGKNAIIVNQSSVAVTVKGNAAENISSNTAGAGKTLADTMVLNPGDSITLSANGGTQWNAYGFSSPGQFPNSKTASGYQKLPNGLIIQWGGNVATTTPTTYAFPIAFPTAALSMAVASQVAADMAAIAAINSSQYSITSVSGAPNASWIAIGY